MGDILRKSVGLDPIGAGLPTPTLAPEGARGTLTYKDVYGPHTSGTLFPAVKAEEAPAETAPERALVAGQDLGPELVSSIINELPTMDSKMMQGFILALLYHGVTNTKRR